MPPADHASNIPNSREVIGVWRYCCTMQCQRASPRPIHSQSSPVTPPGATITYISVVQGTKTIPATGHSHRFDGPTEERRLPAHRINKPQMALRTRGPSVTRTRNAQHSTNSSLQTTEQSGDGATVREYRLRIAVWRKLCGNHSTYSTIAVCLGKTA